MGRPRPATAADAVGTTTKFRRPNSGLARLRPAPVRAPARALGFDLSLVSKLGQDEPDRCRADAGEGALDVAAAELDGRLPDDVVANPLLLVAALLPRGGDAPAEVAIGAGQDPAEIGDPGPNVVLALMPVALRLIEAGVGGELPEQLGQLVLEKPLLSFADIDFGEDRTELAGLTREGLV